MLILLAKRRECKWLHTVCLLQQASANSVVIVGPAIAHLRLVVVLADFIHHFLGQHVNKVVRLSRRNVIELSWGALRVVREVV